VAVGPEATAGSGPGADVAIACCRRTADSAADDLYPDPDAGPLAAALATLGATSRLVAWDDTAADWASYATVVVSSTWDGIDRPAEYLAWARRAASATTLVNAVETLAWDIDKIYLRTLEAAGIPVIPTTWVGPPDRMASVPGVEYVVKPSVSAGGRDTARYAPGDEAGVRHVEALQRAGRTAMVQDYVGAVDTEGETDLVFVAGAFSHAVGKRFALTAGEGAVERPWERMAWSGMADPSPTQRRVAEATMTAVTAALRSQPVYARVDLVTGPEGTPLVLEVELIDPYLSLDLDPDGAARLAAALTRR
jgi:glutathione synthase/RimK-type ligase-like ATP-grasp enzyme